MVSSTHNSTHGHLNTDIALKTDGFMSKETLNKVTTLKFEHSEMSVANTNRQQQTKNE